MLFLFCFFFINIKQLLGLNKQIRTKQNDQSYILKSQEPSPCDSVENITSDETATGIGHTFCSYDTDFNRSFYIPNNPVYIIKCTFEACSCQGGGGCIFVSYDDRWNAPTYGKSLIEDCLFSNCGTLGNGGAIIVNANGYGYQIDIIKCQFLNNFVIGDVDSYGGALYLDCMIGTVKECTFINNTAANGGHAITFCFDNTPNVDLTVSFESNRIEQTQFEENVSAVSLFHLINSRVGYVTFKDNKIKVLNRPSDFKFFTSSNDNDNLEYYTFERNCINKRIL